MKRLVMLGVMFIVVALNGCVSGYVLKANKQQAAMWKAVAANNERAIKDMEGGKTYKEAGMEVSTWEGIKEGPLTQAGAFIADCGIIWGGAEGIQWIADQSGDGDGERSSSTQDSGRDSINYNITGDGNTINHNGDTTTIGGPTESN